MSFWRSGNGVGLINEVTPLNPITMGWVTVRQTNVLFTALYVIYHRIYTVKMYLSLFPRLIRTMHKIHEFDANVFNMTSIISTDKPTNQSKTNKTTSLLVKMLTHQYPFGPVVVGLDLLAKFQHPDGQCCIFNISTFNITAH